MKITKREKKQLGNVSEHLQALVTSICDSREEELPKLLNDNMVWDTSKGTLLNWVAVLNKFDEIIERVTTKYDLVKEFAKPVELDEKDTKIVVAILDFTYLLLNNCTVKSVYASSHRLFDLLNSPTISVSIRVLKIFQVLARKFSIRNPKKTFVSTKKASDRLYPFALFLPASTLTSSTGANDGFSLIDYVKDNIKPPEKWKQLEFIYFTGSNSTETVTKETTTKKLAIEDSFVSSATPSPSKKMKNLKKEEKLNQPKLTTSTGTKSTKIILPEADVRKLSLQQIFDKGSEKLPSKYWLRFGLKALMAKAFNSNSYDNIKLRRDLITLKCLSIASLVSTHNEYEISARLFEAEPTLLTSLVDLINLNNSIPDEVRIAAAKALDSISSMKVWSSEIVRSLGGSVPHGLLYQNLRLIRKQLKTNDSAINEDFNTIFFSIVSNLIDTKSMGSLLVSVGLIQHLEGFLSIRSDYKSTLAGAVHLLDSSLSGNSDNVAIFREHDGFTSLISAITDEVNFALENPGYGGGPPKLTITHYSISYKQANYIRCLLKFTHHLIQKESGDTVRNLFDSPLLSSIVNILTHTSTFGYTILALSLNMTTSIINNEPTSYMILKESGIIDLILKNFEGFFGDSSEIITSLPNVIGAIALNNDGLAKVLEYKLIEKFFKIFDNNSYAKVLVIDDLSDLISGAIDELTRHYNQFKPVIIQEVVKLIKRLPQVGTRDLPRPQIYESKMGSFYLSGNQEVVNHEENASELANWESVEEAYILENALVFIGNLIMSSSTWIVIMDQLPFENWISLIHLKNSPFDYFYSNAMYPLNGALKYFDDEKREYAGKHVINETKEVLKHLTGFSNSQSQESVFHTSTKPEVDDLFNNLIGLNNLLFTFTDVYCNPRSLSAARIQQLAEYFSDDEGIKMLHELGNLIKRTAFEEYILRTSMPTVAANETAPINFEDVFPPLRIIDAEIEETENNAEKTSAKFKNSTQVRFVLHRIHSSITTIFSTLNELPSSSRLHNGSGNKNKEVVVKIVQETGTILSGLLTDDLYQKPAFLLVLVNSIGYCLLNSPTDKILTVGAIMFMQQNGYIKLRDILIHFWSVLKSQDNEKIKNLKPASYVHDFSESIVVSIVMNILVHFNKITVYGQNVNITPGIQFYEGELGDSFKSVNLKPSFIVQAKLLSIGVLLSIFDENSLDTFDDERKFPIQVIEEIINLAKNSYSHSGTKELDKQDGSLIKIDWKQVGLSYNRLQYLKQIGFQDDEASEVLSISRGSLMFLKSSDLPEGFTDLQRWKEIKQNSKINRYRAPEVVLIPPQYQSYHTITDLETLMQLKSDYLLDQFYLLTQLHPQVTRNMTEFLISGFLNRSNVNVFEDILYTIVEFIFSFEFPDEDSPRLAGMIGLFAGLLMNDTVFYGCRSAIDSFVEGVVQHLKPENANTDWAIELIVVFGRLVAAYNLPSFEKLNFAFSGNSPKPLPVPPKISNEVYDQIFEVLINIPSVESPKNAFFISSILSVYALNPDYAKRITQSSVIKYLIRNIGKADKLKEVADDNQRNRSVGSQVTLTALIRFCFESKEFITERVLREISKQFTSKKDGSKDKPKDLMMLLKDAHGTVLRAPELFAEEVSKVARLRNFSEPLNNWIVSYNKQEDPDVAMSDVEIKPDLSSSDASTLDNQTGIIHLVITELMTASKTDWTSDPPLTADEEKKKASEKILEIPKVEKTDSYKNNNCAYIIYLLKLLAELLASYKQSKIEFLTFSKKQLFENKEGENTKPRSTSLNFLLHQFITGPGKATDPAEETRRSLVAKFASKVIVSFVSSIETKELKADPKKVDPDLTFIRKFTIDSILKVTKESASVPNLESRYHKLVSIANIIPLLVSNLRDKLVDPLTVEFDDFQIAKIILESDLVKSLTKILSEVDLNYPDYFFTLESVLLVLNNLASTKKDRQELFRANQPINGIDEEEVEEDENDFKEETPDLFQNSTLGMYDVAEIDSEDEFTDDDIGYNEDDVSDDDDRDDDDIDEQLLSGRDLEIVYSEDGEENSEDEEGVMISSDEGEVVEDSESEDESEDESMSQESVSLDSDGGFVGYDIASGSDIQEGEYDSENGYDSENDDDSGFENEYFSENDSQNDYGVRVIGIDEEDDEEDSELEEVMEDIINQDDHREHHDHHHHHHHGHHHSADLRLGIEEMASRAGISINTDSFSDNGFVTDEEDGFGDSSISDSDDSLNEFSGRDFADATNFHTRGQRYIPNPSLQRIRNTFSNVLGIGSNLIRTPNFGGEVLFNGLFDKSKTNEQFNYLSTRERWNAFADSTFSKNEDFIRVLNTILNNIYEPSKELHELKVKEEEERKKLIDKELYERLENTMKQKTEEEARLREQAEGQSDHEDISIDDEETGRSPIMVRIGDRDVDIAGTDIDPEFFEALPEDIREEVFTQHVRERRAEASQSGDNTREIAPEFLEALPEGIREEIIAQETAQARFNELSVAIGANADTDNNETIQDEEGDSEDKKKEKQKVFYTPLVDNAGVSSLIRFVYVPQSFNGRKSLYRLLAQISVNKKTRAEVLGNLVAILHYGISDQESLEKSFLSITNSAQSSSISEQTDVPKTPTKSHSSAHALFPHRTTPFIVASQALEALQFLLETDPQLRYYFLTEHEGISFSKKPLSARKPGLIKASKYPLNTLLGLLNKGIIRDKSNLMDLLSRIIQITTRPLHAMNQVATEKKKIELPSVLNSNLRNVITILVSDDCSSRTFQQTLSAIQNLLIVCPDGKVFAAELSKHAKKLGVSLVADFKTLLEELSKNTNVKDYDSIMVKYTSSNSDQSKLLRVLTALDYLFGKRDDKVKVSDAEEEARSKELTEIYTSLELGELWGALSETLELFEANKNITTVATALLPIIEALMVICKNSRVKDLQNKDNLKYESKKVDFVNEPIENLFFVFTDSHKKILNTMVRSNPKLMSGPFTMLVENPRVLEFDNKKNYFDRQLHTEQSKERSNLQISVRREQVFLDSYRSLFFKSKEQFRDSKLEINFKGEAGVDAGGVTREWYQVLSRQMFNPDYALFLPVASDKTTFHPNRTSWVNPEHLSFFKFIGRVIGKAIYDNCFLDCHFSRDVYKSILGRPVSLKDLETIDLEYYNSLMWMLENDITDVIIETFSVETEDYGEVTTVDLIPDGRNISVTEDNKNEYVRLVVEYRLQESVKEQVDNFLQGFHEIIPKSLISIFDEQELELLISGLPDIDVDDWKNNSVYVNYTASSKEISYFWRAVRSFDKEERAKLLQFATGTSKVPLNGFKELEGSNGSTKFSIHKDFGSIERLPSSHTCFNQIDLPAYDSYETLRGSLLLAITEGHEGFGLQ